MLDSSGNFLDPTRLIPDGVVPASGSSAVSQGSSVVPIRRAGTAVNSSSSSILPTARRGASSVLGISATPASAPVRPSIVPAGGRGIGRAVAGGAILGPRVAAKPGSSSDAPRPTAAGMGTRRSVIKLGGSAAT